MNDILYPRIISLHITCIIIVLNDNPDFKNELQIYFVFLSNIMRMLQKLTVNVSFYL